ncbi:MAG: CNNM domain-containing protein [Acidobacteriota bacterium]
MNVFLATEALAVLLMLAISAFFSSSEAAFFSLKPWQVGHREEGSGAVARLLRDPSLLLICLMLGNETVNVLLSFLSSSLRSRLLPQPWGVSLGILATTAVLVLLGEAIPKAVAANEARRISRSYAPLLEAYVKTVAPAGRFLLRLLDRTPSTSRAPGVEPLDELHDLFTAARVEGAIQETEENLLGNLIRMAGEPASSRMVPRTSMHFVGAKADKAAVLASVAGEGEPWVCVYGHDADDLLGLVGPEELLGWSLDDRPGTAAQWCRQVPIYPESRPIRLVLGDLYKEGWPAVVLADEYGGIAGFITRISLAASLFCTRVAESRGGSGVLLPGATAYAEFRERFPRAPEDLHCRTLAGHLLNLAARVPAQGAVLRDSGYEYRVVKATSRQIQEVEIGTLEPSGRRQG